jgi:hypothetical protein
LIRIGGGLQSPQGYLLSGVTATLADQLGSAVFFSSGVGTSGVSLEICLSYVDTATVGVRPISLSRTSCSSSTDFCLCGLEIFGMKLRFCGSFHAFRVRVGQSVN